VLSGINSSGKSSVLQSLLLLRQSHLKGRLSSGLDLNAPLCDIGKGSDALHHFASQDEIISFSLNVDNLALYDFRFNANNKYDDTFLPQDNIKTLSDDLLHLSLFTNNFQYLSAARWAGLNFYPMDSYAVEKEKQLSLNYGQGELVAHFLEYYGDSRNFEVKSKLLLHPNASSKKLLEQTIAWEGEISPRVTIKPEKRADKVSIEYGYKGVGNNRPLKGLNAKNIGFGISYSLPIVVALLAADPGSLLLLENPEAHLHPRGQSKLVELMALAAQSGVQLFVETHSDHIFNGIRKAIAANKIEKEHVKVHFFELDDTNASVSTEIQISDHGRVLNHKKGLFDQFDDDLDALLEL
jgi:predicted ATPase